MSEFEKLYAKLNKSIQETLEKVRCKECGGSGTGSKWIGPCNSDTVEWSCKGCDGTGIGKKKSKK